MAVSFSSTFPADPINLKFPNHSIANPNPSFASCHCPNPLFLRCRTRRLSSATSGDRTLNGNSPAPCHSRQRPRSLKSPPDSLRNLASSAIVFLLGLGIRICSAAASTQIPAVSVANCPTVVEEQKIEDNFDVGKSRTMENLEDKELNAAFEKWKSRTYALTVPLRIIALRGSLPPSWVKDFIKSQGKRVRLRLEIYGSLNDNALFKSFTNGNVDRKSAVAADIISIGDSWLNFAIKKGVIEPLEGIENQDWYKCLGKKWKVYLCRNNEGNLDPEGKIWAAPYRWGTMVIAYKKSKFQKHNLSPIEDWADLWRPELTGKISMVDSPREVVGTVLKSMGASYNTCNIDAQVAGGRNAVGKKLTQLSKQVRLFDSVHYLKAFGVGDVWVAVGWSSDVLPVAKRMSNVTVIVPKSGSSLWVDLWAIPAASRFATNKIGGRVRGPSPLIHQWIEFCLQAASALPLQQQVIPGASPSSLHSTTTKESEELTKGKPKLETNLISGVPPRDILDQCEFLEPLPDAALADYQWLIASMQKSHCGLIQRMGRVILSSLGNLLPGMQCNPSKSC
ncbi:uncharacterized protein LOC127813161 [Diospyros lotus]|uniref:uncharacterized protein LOC127813161 n=1 Tax=Diospyros lotus TaxID=55363 RepID=UPI00224F4579|nr:uncharacterized protein LOC127813161 [Diospyros lotus]